MSWLFGGRSSEPEARIPETTYGQKQKHKQVEWLREEVVGVVEVTRDERYRVTITVQGNPIILDIVLPFRFPLVGPVVSVSPPVRHPWVNQQMVVDGSPLIKNFSVHSNLGRAVNQVIKEFTEHPPEPMASPPYPSQPSLAFPRPSPVAGGYTPFVFNSIPHPVPVAVGAGSPKTRVPRRPPPPVPTSTRRLSYHVPAMPDTFPDIRELSEEELAKFLSDENGPVLIDRYVSQLDVIKKVQLDSANLFQENEVQAGINMSHEPEIQDGWTELQTKFLELQAMREEHDKMLRQQRQLIERYEKKTVISRLRTLSQETDTDSEVMAEEFLEQKMAVAEFVQKYKKIRKLYHLRKSKYEKLTFDRAGQ